MEKPQYWESDEKWNAYEEYVLIQLESINSCIDSLPSLKRVVEIARGSQSPPSYPVKFD